jgi:hypothetical protein
MSTTETRKEIMSGSQGQRPRLPVTLGILLGTVLTLALTSAFVTGCGRSSTSTEDLSSLYYWEGGMTRLTAEGKERAKEIALSDPRVVKLLEGKNYAVAQKFGEKAVNTRIGIWHAESDPGNVLGAGLEIWFDQPYTFAFGSWGILAQPEEAEALVIKVSFPQHKVVEITPLCFGS